MVLIHCIRWFSNEYKRNNISAHSAQVSFFTVISLFPLAMFLLTLLQYIPIGQQVIIDGISRIIPATLVSTVTKWIMEIYEKGSGTVVGLTIFTTLWASSKGFLGIIIGINKIYNGRDDRNFIQKRFLSLLYTLCFIVLIVLSLLILVYGNKIFLFINNQIPLIGSWLTNIFPFRILIGFAIFVLFFVLLYTIIPQNTDLRFRAQIPGALITSISWIVFSYLYSIYVDNFSNMTSIYGSLTYIVVFMLWLYICMNLVFVGAEVNVFLHLIQPQDNKKK